MIQKKQSPEKVQKWSSKFTLRKKEVQKNVEPEIQKQKKRDEDNPNVLTRISTFFKDIKPSNKIKSHIEAEEIH